MNSGNRNKGFTVYGMPDFSNPDIGGMAPVGNEFNVGRVRKFIGFRIEDLIGKLDKLADKILGYKE